MREFVREHGIKTLNVAGSRESKEPGILDWVASVIEDAIFQPKKYLERSASVAAADLFHPPQPSPFLPSLPPPDAMARTANLPNTTQSGKFASTAAYPVTECRQQAPLRLAMHYPRFLPLRPAASARLRLASP
jgi:hypothetical protein